MTIAGMVIRPKMIALKDKGSRDAIVLFLKIGAMAPRVDFKEIQLFFKKKMMILIHGKGINRCLNVVLQENMVLEWKERGHEAKEFQEAQDSECINSLRN